jgi:hypothetical protein
MWEEGEIRPFVSDDEFGRLRITIPAPRNWAFVLFLMVWLCGWAVGEVLVPARLLPNFLAGRRLAASELVILLVWLPGWTVAGLCMLLNLAWNMIGKETITLGKGGIELQAEAGPIRRTRWLELVEVSNLRYAPRSVAPNPWDGRLPMNVFGSGGSGSIALDGTDRTYYFGVGLSEYESRRVIATIEQRFQFPGPYKVEPLPTSA